MLKRILAITKKEIRQIRRDNKFIAILIFFPMMLLILNGYAFNFDVKNIKIGIYDEDKSKESREFISVLSTSGYFVIKKSYNSKKEFQESIEMGEVRGIVVIPTKFGNLLSTFQPTKIQVLIDGMEPNAANTTIGYIQGIAQQYSQKIIIEGFEKRNQKIVLPIQLDSRVLYNPEMKSSLFFVPGLIALILAITGVLATALSIVREKEKNTIEQILISPVTPFEMIFGKVIPYSILSFISSILVLIAAYFMFDVVVKGSYFLLFISTILFILAALNLGILVSTIATTQQVAFQIGAIISLLPTFILSGLIFPIRSMPFFLQIISNITPAKYYLIILRSIVVKGVGLESFWNQILNLILFNIIVVTISVIRYKRNAIKVQS
ncbi:MAG: ABC transporter permease [Bacteroidetes bacterium]|nr:ABC transporter permease [Bacteroidota bacterium]